jgi:hypothetical protein
MLKNMWIGATALLAVSSCGEDRDDDNATQATIHQKIVGTWTIVKKESNGTNVPASLPCLNLGNFVFDSNNKLFENHNSVVNNNCITDTDNYTFTVDENNKKITAKNTQNDVLIYSVSSLSENELVLVNSEGSNTTKYTFSK